MQPGSTVRLGLLALLWGSNFLLIAIALDGFTPTQILAGRLALGAVVLVAIVYLRGDRLPTDITTWGHLTVAAIVANVIPYWLFAWAEQTIPSSIAGVLNATTPLATFALATIAMQDRDVTRRRVFGLFLGFVGVLLVAQPWTAGASGQLAGLIGALAASMSYAVGYVYQRRYLTSRGLRPLVLAAGQLACATAISVPFAAVTFTAYPAGPRSASIGLVALGALGTGAAYVLNYRLIEDEGPTQASTVTYLLPVVAVILGVMALSEPITLGSALGAVAILTGVALTRQRLPMATS